MSLHPSSAEFRIPELTIQVCRKSPSRKVLALGRDLSHDALNSDVADHLEDDLLLHSPVDSDSTIVSADLQNTLRFGEVQKVVAKGLFLQTRWASC